MGIENRATSEYSQTEMIEIKKEFSDLVVVTQTFYGSDETSKVRQQLALNFLNNAKSLGLKVVLVDGGSNEDFLKQVKENFQSTAEILSETEVPNEDKDPDGKVGMGTGRRFGFTNALANQNAKYFLWAEPEKDGLLTVDNLRSMLKSLKQGEADICVPKRLSKETMVPIQGWLETWANKIAAKLHAEQKNEAPERPLDLWFGPKMFNRAGAEEFISHRSSLNKWEAIIAPPLKAERKGLRVNSVDVNYSYDQSQVKNEIGNHAMDKKRWEQFLSILGELGSQEAALFYRRLKDNKPLEVLVPEVIKTFGMDEDMPAVIKEYLKDK